MKNIALAFLCALDTEKAVGRTTCNFFLQVLSPLLFVTHCLGEIIFKS